LSVGSCEDERIAGSLRERKVVGNGVDLVHELASVGSLFEDEFSRGESELLNHFSVREEEFLVLRIGRTHAHPTSLFRMLMGRLLSNPWTRPAISGRMGRRSGNLTRAHSCWANVRVARDLSAIADA
jgi:hypothetical protein